MSQATHSSTRHPQRRRRRLARWGVEDLASSARPASLDSGQPRCDHGGQVKGAARPYADRIRQSVLLVHGSSDMVMPIHQSIDMERALGEVLGDPSG